MTGLKTGLKTRGFHHIGMITADGARAVLFYRDLLGLDLLGRSPASGAGDPARLFFGDEAGRPGTILALDERPGARRGGWGVGGVHHVALGVGTADAQLKWKRRLEDAGVRVTGPYDRGYFTSIYFGDADGHVVEIATAGPGYFIDESPEELGRELRIPPERLLRGHRDEAAIAALTWPEPVPEIGPDMRLDGIHHVSGITDDLGRALDWYPEVLGLDVIKRTVNRDDGRTHHYFWAAREGDAIAPHSSWTLFGWPGSDYRARDGVGQTRHVAFRAADEEELGAWRDRLLGLGIEVSEVLDRKRYRTLQLTAPDGQRLEIATDGPGFGRTGSRAGRDEDGETRGWAG